jgi:hypothetical protein
MQNTFAHELIQTFSKQELREARKWLASPYFNQREDLQQLFEVLAEEGEVPGRVVAWKRLFPDKAYDDQQLRLLLSYLYRSLEQFLWHRELEHYHPHHTRHLLLTAFRRRGLERHFTKAYRKQAHALEQENMQHPEHHLAQYWLERELFQQQSQGERTREHNLQVMEDTLTLAFLSMKLRQACWLLAHEAVYKASYTTALESAVLEAAAEDAYRDQPAIAVYLNCYRMLKHVDESHHFIAFRDWLFKMVAHFPEEELRDLFLLGINYCIRQINRKASAYLREALELYKKGLETSVLLDDGRLSPFTYNNVAGIALRLQELEWTEEFLHTYRPLLNEQQREAAFSLNAARLAFVKNDYSTAIGYLQRADYRDFINNMVAKTLLLKCYYELEELDLLDYHLKTMRSFLRRKRRMGYHQQNYRNIVKLTFRLLKLTPGDKKAIELLRKDIQQTEPLTEGRWLMEKVEQR